MRDERVDPLQVAFPRQVPNMKEIILIGFYQPNDELNRFITSAQQEFKFSIRWEYGTELLRYTDGWSIHPSWSSSSGNMFRYLQEFAALGTGGGIYHFRDQILSGGPSAFFLMNADVCSEFPLQEMLRFHQQCGTSHSGVILGTTVNLITTCHWIIRESEMLSLCAQESWRHVYCLFHPG